MNQKMNKEIKDLLLLMYEMSKSEDRDQANMLIIQGAELYEKYVLNSPPKFELDSLDITEGTKIRYEKMAADIISEESVD